MARTGISTLAQFGHRVMKVLPMLAVCCGSSNPASRMRPYTTRLSLLLALSSASLLLTAQVVCAGTTAYSSKQVQQRVETFDPYRKGVTEVELSAGHFWSVGTKGTVRRPDTEWIMGSARFGWMLNDASGSGPFRGNWEFLVGAFGDYFYDGPGNYFVGADLNLRYNFVQPNATVVPFIQIGAGGAYGDWADEAPEQGLVGTDWNWELQGALGVRWMLSERLALVTYAQWQHFSNGGSSNNNRGLNGVGAMAGLSWFF
ncbi:lipid A 3-O-deacylase PagL [Roseimicrobium gellanilyticum]|uniref:Lipid A 3-O-deacylase PagL n=2 Tax=Roseimicrobium gellanilyticum TaxID=748857 RepID=A0A366H1D5_9BACT|nr:lipid A 3-O-deacylase PagL [Roseimicrobium gellanilyticum]